MEETILEAVRNVGFPIVVALFVLVRLERRVSELTEAVKELVRATKANGSERST